MITYPSIDQVKRAKQKSPWDFGNEILYRLCRDNFTHKQSDKTLTKVLFIGRIYATAIERRKNKEDEINDNFYIDTVEPTFFNSHLDDWLQDLNRIKEISIDRILQILKVHYSLTSILYNITHLNKRSFCSKYLHFHLPELFFIYDSRALIGLRTFINKVPKELKSFTLSKNIDQEYAKFFCKCFYLKQQIQKNHNISLTNRELDNILIEIANNLLIKKSI